MIPIAVLALITEALKLVNNLIRGCSCRASSG